MISRRRVSALVALATVAAGVLVTAAFFYVRGSRQPRAGEIEFAELTASVSVGFDEWAIPTIIASSELDAMRAQGFVHASERLWQLELFQRIGRGRLAEVFGESVLSTDRLLRTLDLWGVAGRELATLGDEVRALLEAYAEGVNARMRTWEGPWPPEFLILGLEPQAWTPQASLAIGRIMALDLSGWSTELSRIHALSRLGPEHRAVLGAGYPAWGPTILQESGARGDSSLRASPDGAKPGATGLRRPAAAGGRSGRMSKAGGGRDHEPSAALQVDPLRFLASFGLHGSNSWALGGSRTADGHPLLANDMHLSLRAPSTWYLNVLRTEGDGYAVAGLSIPGSPGVVVGLTRSVAWGFTNAMVDDADFIVESVNLDGSMYRDADEWRSFDVREESIVVRGRDEPVRFAVRSTSRGPVFTDVVPAGGLTLSLLWTGLETDAAVVGLVEMNRARTAEQFEAALSKFRSPHQNVIYATTTGLLGYRMVGSVPQRGSEDGSLPISSERLPEGWSGFWPPDSLPALRRPASDYLGSANNLQSRAVYGRVGVDYPAPFRALRIDGRLAEARGWTVADMRDLQLDSYSSWAERLRPRAIAAARRVGADDAAAALDAWDLRTEVESIGPAVFYTWLYRLRELIASDEFEGDEPWFPDVALIDILEDPDNVWIDDVRTPGPETLEELEDAAVRPAGAMARTRWGEVHQERSVHPLGAVPLLDRIFGFNIGPYPARGGRHTVRPDDPHLRAPLDSTSWLLPIVGEYGPSERLVAHLAPGRAVAHVLLPTGQSGNPLDEHYRDMSRVWSESPLVEIDPAGSLERARSVLRLVPRPPAPDSPR